MTHAGLRGLVEAILVEVKPLENPYFVSLRDGTMAREDFLETQVQFHRAVENFHRPMAVLAVRIPDPTLRTPILRNVWEEVGEGDPTAAHGVTFRELLWRLDQVPAARVHSARPWPEVDVFNLAISGACAEGSPVFGAAAMGMIERMFGELSGVIGRAIVARAWLTADAMIHYDLHEALDVRHAEDFFAVVEPSFLGGEAARLEVERGLRFGATVFDGLYRGLYAGRARRWGP